MNVYSIMTPNFEVDSSIQRRYTIYEMQNKPKTIVECLKCGKEFQSYPYLIRKGNGKYCSRECSQDMNTTKIKKGQHLSPRTEFKKGLIPHNYKGDEVGIAALHSWAKRKLDKPVNCQHCGKERRLHLANKDHEYKRNLTDWLWLCVSCHFKYDLAMGLRLPPRKKI